MNGNMDGRIDPPEYTPGPCARCERPASDHATYCNVQNEQVTICPDTDALTDLQSAVESVLRIWRETQKRLGHSTEVPDHLGCDIAVVLWEVYGDEECQYEEVDEEDEEYAARGGHFRGCDGENCGC